MNSGNPTGGSHMFSSQSSLCGLSIGPSGQAYSAATGAAGLSIGNVDLFSGNVYSSRPADLGKPPIAYK